MATSSQSSVLRGIVGLILIVAAIGGGVFLSQSTTSPEEKSLIDPAETHLAFKPRKLTDISGFMTILSMASQPELFSTGVAIAPVGEWTGYDTAYTLQFLSDERVRFIPYHSPDRNRTLSAELRPISGPQCLVTDDGVVRRWSRPTVAAWTEV